MFSEMLNFSVANVSTVRSQCWTCSELFRFNERWHLFSLFSEFCPVIPFACNFRIPWQSVFLLFVREIWPFLTNSNFCWVILWGPLNRYLETSICSSCTSLRQRQQKLGVLISAVVFVAQFLLRPRAFCQTFATLDLAPMSLLVENLFFK